MVRLSAAMPARLIRLNCATQMIGTILRLWVSFARFRSRSIENIFQRGHGMLHVSYPMFTLSGTLG